MVKDFLFVGSSYLIIAFVVAILVYFVFRMRVLGKFWMVLILAVAGSVLGAIINVFLGGVFHFLANLNSGKFNLFPSLFFSFLFVWLFSYLTQQGNKN